MRKTSFIFLTLLNLCFLFFISGERSVVLGQKESSADEKRIVSPVEEIFEAADGLALPWRSGGCIIINPELNDPNCRKVSVAEWNLADNLTLYNDDGSVWYHFNISPNNPEYYLKNKKEGFLPFAFYPNKIVGGVFLRIAGESPNWYKVEVNEDSQATKYILKTDPLWVKRDWNHFFALMKFFKYKENSPELLDQPDGKIVKETAGLIWHHLKFIKTKGEWAFVRGVNNSTLYYGWIRWRRDREILTRYDESIAINHKIR